MMFEEKRYAQISNESIQIWGDANGVTDLSQDILLAIASDSTYRLREVLDVCGQFLRHSKRQRLTTDDFNRSLKWMDVPPIYGYSGSEGVDYVHLPELGIHVPHDPHVNLSSSALSGDIFHQPGSPYVQAEWAHVSGHVILKSECNAEEKSLAPLPLCAELSKYYQTLFSVITNPSHTLFQMMCDDVGKSPNLGPLVGPIIGGVLKVAQKARQKPIILRRLLLVIRALLVNPYLHFGPQNYIRDIVNVLVFCVVTERKNPHDTQSIRTLAANILLMLSINEGECGTAWELAVMNLSGVAASTTRPWAQHAGALRGLLALGPSALQSSLLPIAEQYYERLSHALCNAGPSKFSAIVTKDTLDANMTSSLFMSGLVNILVALIKKLPDKQKIYVRTTPQNSSNGEHSSLEESRPDDKSHHELVRKIYSLYSLGRDMFGPAFALQIPLVYIYLGREDKPGFLRSSVYHEHAKSDESLLREFTTNPTSAKRLKRTHSSASMANRAKHDRLNPTQPSNVFENYVAIEPLKSRRMYMCVLDCSTRRFEFLKRKGSSLPQVEPHCGRPLLVRYNETKPTGKMPHCTFTRPLRPPARPGCSLNYLIL